MSRGVTLKAQIGSLALLLMELPVFAFQQKTFIAVAGANRSTRRSLRAVRMR